MTKRKLKIAFVSFYQSDVNRGVESFVHELATRLSHNHEVTVFQRVQIDKKVSYKVESFDFTIDWKQPDVTGSKARKLYIDYWSRQIGKHAVKVFPRILKADFDIVIPLNNGWQSLLMRLVTVFSKSKLIFVGQSGLGWDERVSSFLFPTKYIALTSYQKEWLLKKNPFVEVTVIPNAVDTKRFKKVSKKEISLQSPVVLLVSALTKWKRIDLAVRAVAKTKASLVVVGDGAEKENLERLMSKLLPNRFVILSLPYSKIHDIYESADLFTFPTVPWESFGIVLLEAMAAGLPVVTTDDPIRREIVGDAGLFVDPTDIDAYAETIRKALIAKWGHKPYDQAKKFDWEIIANKYEKLFIEITK